MAKRVSLQGKGADLFFGGYPADQPGDTPDKAEAAPSPITGEEPPAAPRRRQAARKTSTPASKAASTEASTLAIPIGDDGLVADVRRVVKDLGKEVSFVRLTPAEKDELAEVVFAFRRKGLKTTENEINRIAINALLADHRAHGDDSLLARVLAALRA